MNFIRNGGGYLGVCAGAYFAASGSDVYLHAIELKHSQPWPRGRGLIEIELTPEGQKLLGTAEGLPAALGAVAFRGENRPHWLWIQRRELNESLKKPLIRITPETADALAAELPGLFEDKVTIHIGGIAEEFSCAWSARCRKRPWSSGRRRRCLP